MSTLQIICAGIVALYVILALKTTTQPGRFALLFVLLVGAAWIAENSVIQAYGFYAYSREWSAFLHHVPLLIVCIWPVVIHSAYALARDLMGPGQPAAGLTGFIVLTDAALIEPVAVHAGLWTWSDPGPFGVPPIGVIGWAIFAVAVGAVLDWAGSRTKKLGRLPLLLLVGPGITHVALLVLWWGMVRWLPTFATPWPWVVGAGLVSAAVTTSLLRTGHGARVRAMHLWGRAPGAVFFFGLLAWHPPSTTLLLWALAFLPPYLALGWTIHRRSRVVNN